MNTINKYYKSRVNGVIDYVLAPDSTVLRASDSVVIAKLVGSSTSEETSVYELSLMGGSKTLTDYAGIQNLFGSPTPGSNYAEYVKTILEDGRREFVSTGDDVYITDQHAVGYAKIKDGYDNIEDALDEESSVSCYRVQLKDGSTVIINGDGRSDLEDDWC